MSNLETTAIVIGIIVGIIAIISAIYKVCEWFFSKKETKHETHPAPKVKKTTRKKSDDSSADASGEGSVAIGKSETININQSIPAGQIFLTETAYKEILNDAVNVKKLELQIAHGEEKAQLQLQIDELKNRLTNLPQAFEEAKKRIASLESTLKREGNKIGGEKSREAVDSLKKGDFSKADDIFKEIEADAELAVQRSARAAYSRGEIAEHEIRWQDAFKHYIRAVKLEPNFYTITKAQKLATMIGDYSSALSFGKDMQKISIREYGRDSNQYATSLNNLSELYREHGRYKDAELILTEVLEIRKKILPENHPDIAIALSNLAQIYKEQKKYKEAEPVNEQALMIFKKAFGEEHPNTAFTIHNLGGLYHAQGLHEKAELFYQKALKIRREKLGNQHPNTANSLNNLATLYLEQKQYKKAELFLKEALKICKKIFGDKHPRVATCLNNLSGLYDKQKRYKKSETFIQQAIEILEFNFEPDHPDIKLTKANYKILKERIANAEKNSPQ